VIQKDGSSSGEVWIGSAMLSGNLGYLSSGTPAGSVSVDRVNSTHTEGELLAALNIAGTALLSPALDTLRADTGIFNDIAVVGDVGSITTLDSPSGADEIGTSGNPVSITITDGSLITSIVAGEIYADIEATGTGLNEGKIERIYVRRDGGISGT